MATYQLRGLDVRLAYLAIAYHLGRPGSELDRDARSHVEHGLSQVADDLQSQLDAEVAAVDLSDEQRQRLLNAMSGSINELKAFPLMPAEGRRQHSPASGFHGALGRLFPEVQADAEEAIQLAAHMLTLRRRLDAAG